MAYVALYRKYRSQDFEDVIGQEHVTRTLQNAIERGRIGQAFLFTGSRGCGKTTVARLLAKAVNCENGPTPHPCNQCQRCRAITQGAAVDVAEVDAASNRGVAEMEAICDSVRYQPMEARYRVVILDEAHQLSDHAKDAFLKTLEEPPPHAIFVLATTEPSKIPITIRSRCQQFDFHRGTLTQVEDRLKWVCGKEEVALADEAAQLIAAHAQGSWRDGLSLLEQVIAFAGNTVTAEDARKVLGAVPEEVPAAIVLAIAANDPARVMEESRKSWGAGADPFRLLAAVVEYCRNRLEDLIAGRSVDPTLSQMGPERLIKLIYSLADSESALRNWERADLAIEVALLSAMAGVHQREAPQPARPEPPAAKAQPSASGTSAAASRQTAVPATPAREPRAQEAAVAEPATSGTPASESEPSGGTPLDSTPSSGDADLDMLIRAWPRVIQHLRKDRANTSLCAILKDGQPTSFLEGELTITFPATHAFHASRTEAGAGKVADAFQHVASAKVRVKSAVAGSEQKGSSDSGGARKAAPAGAPADHAPPAAEVEDSETGASDLVQEVLKTFGGEVLDDQDPFSPK